MTRLMSEREAIARAGRSYIRRTLAPLGKVTEPVDTPLWDEPARLRALDYPEGTGLDAAFTMRLASLRAERKRLLDLIAEQDTARRRPRTYWRAA
ncbi:hypothetical protein QVL82_01160 [Cellulosimicrobium funkei]|uniref:hypothetical protein n=1 Tax=Cellulosimicrobium funkei TaxID=264251 RepID=UPI003757CF68